MLQLLAVTYGPHYLFPDMGVARNKLIPVVIAFAINYAAYFAEIYRGGIESMPVGQYEAAGVLGYTKVQTFMRIILPQVVKRIMPSITNEVVTPGEGHLYGLLRVSYRGDVHHRQADRQLPDQLHALPYRRRVLLRCSTASWMWSWASIEKRMDYYQ
ncbi:MAG: ABC transporter permease subunit [Oscillospiraceae bacterium]